MLRTRLGGNERELLDRALSEGASTALVISAFKRSVTAAGTLAGPQIPYQDNGPKAGMPLCATVGTSRI